MRVLKDGSRKSSRCKPGDRNFGGGRDSGTQAGIWNLGRRFVVGESPPIADAFAATPPRDQIREEKKDEKVRGWEGVTPAVLLTRVVVVRSVPCCSPRRPPAPRPPVAEVAAFESCMLTMLTEVVWVCAHLRKARASAVDVDPSRWRRWPAMRACASTSSWVLLGGTVRTKHHCCA